MFYFRYNYVHLIGINRLGTETVSLVYTSDKEFLRKLTEIVLVNLNNRQFGVEELSKNAGISRSYLNRRLKNTGNQSVNHFIRTIRLQKAREMLLEEDIPASEIADRVGFGSPTYFNQCFHELYGISPGEARRRYFLESVPVKEDQTPYIPEEQPSPDVRTLKKSGINPRKIGLMISAGIIVLVFLTFIFYNSVFSRHRSGTGRYNAEKSIIVLPFKNFSQDTINQYFAEGIMEDILSCLGTVSDLRVISRTTSEHFKGSRLTAGEIAKEVRARNVLEGSIRQEGKMVRISVQLIDAEQDHHLWSANFDREFTNILGLQGEIARQVADELHAVISGKEISRLRTIPTQNPEAYDYYLRGRFLHRKADSEQTADFDKEGLMAGIQYYEKAIEKDKDFALAYAALANAWFSLSSWGWLPKKEGFPKAREYSSKALEIDPDCGEAHAIKGALYIWGDRKFEEGRKELLLSLRLGTALPLAHQAYAQLLMITGPIQEARKHMDLTLKLEPYFWVAHNLNAWIYYFEGRHREGLEACRLARELKPDFNENNWLFFLNYSKLGEGEKAAEELRTIVSKIPDTDQYIAEITKAYNLSGIPGLFTWLTEVNLNKPLPAAGLSGHPYFIAWWYAILLDKERSIYWLEKNMAAKLKHFEYFNLIATNPDFDILRNDPRFLSIIDQIGLTPYNTRKAR